MELQTVNGKVTLICGHYAVLSDSIFKTFDDHKKAFDFIQSLPYGVKGVFKICKDFSLGPVNIYQGGKSIWEFDAGRYLTRLHNVNHKVI